MSWKRGVSLLLGSMLLFVSSWASAKAGSCFAAHTGKDEIVAPSKNNPTGAPRTVMVQLFEWPWLDIARECEVELGPKGFSAVQISPPQEHLVLGEHKWWERYQPVSYKLISRAGNETEFREMVRRCQAAGVDIYADVVVNHMAGMAEGVGFNGTRYRKYHHDALYDENDFNFCGRNGNNQIQNYLDRFELQFCELLGLADLKTGSKKVRDRLRDYLNALLDTGVKGFRLDAAKHVPAEDLAAIVSGLKAPAYLISETLVGLQDVISLSEYTSFSDVNVFPYAWDLARSLWDKKLSSFPMTLAANLPASHSAVVFVENHDTQRANPRHTLSLKTDPDLYRLANVLMLTWPYGYPQLFSGYDFIDYDQGPPVDSKGRTISVLDSLGRCQSPWLCEHRLPGMAELIRFRNETDSAFYASKIWKEGGERIAFSRGALGFAVINAKNESLHTRIPTDLPDGIYCDLSGPSGLNPLLCGNQVQVRMGQVQVDIPPRSTRVLLHSVKVGDNTVTR